MLGRGILFRRFLPICAESALSLTFGIIIGAFWYCKPKARKSPKSPDKSPINFRRSTCLSVMLNEVKHLASGREVRTVLSDDILFVPQILR